MKGIMEITWAKPSSHGLEQSLELAQAWAETAATNQANLLHHAWIAGAEDIPANDTCTVRMPSKEVGWFTHKQAAEEWRNRTKIQAFFGPASAFSTWTHFIRVGLVSPDAHAFLLSGLLALWGCGSSTHNLERLSSHWQFTAEYEDILNKTLAVVENLKNLTTWNLFLLEGWQSPFRGGKSKGV